MELKGDAVIKGLLYKYTEFIIQKSEKYLLRALPLISNNIIKTALMENKFSDTNDFGKLSEYFKLRVIVDYISGMTDQYALSQFWILHD